MTAVCPVPAIGNPTRIDIRLRKYNRTVPRYGQGMSGAEGCKLSRFYFTVATYTRGCATRLLLQYT